MLKPEDYGTVAALLNLGAIVLIPSDTVQALATRAAATLSARDQLSHVHDLWLRLTRGLLVLGGVAALIFCTSLAGPVAHFFRLPSSGLVMLVGLLYLGTFVFPLNQGLLLGLRQFGWYAAITACAPMLRVVFAATFVTLGLGVTGAVLGLVLAAWLGYLCSLAPVWRRLHRVKRQSTVLAPWLGYSVWAAIATGCIAVLANLDMVLARHFLNAVEAGQYAALATTGKMLLFIGASVPAVMFPSVAAAHARGERHRYLLWLSLGAVTALSLPVLALFVIAPSAVLRHVFGSSYSGAGPYLPVYGLAMMFLALIVVLVQYFLSLDRRGLVQLLLLAGCAAQVLTLWRWHANIGQISHALVVVFGLLGGALLLYACWKVPPDVLVNNKLGEPG